MWYRCRVPTWRLKFARMTESIFTAADASTAGSSENTSPADQKRRSLPRSIAKNRDERAAVDALQRKELDKVYEVDGLMAESSRLFDAALSATLLKAGYHHHRGEWRKKRSGHGSQI